MLARETRRWILPESWKRDESCLYPVPCSCLRNCLRILASILVPEIIGSINFLPHNRPSLTRIIIELSSSLHHREILFQFLFSSSSFEPQNKNEMIFRLLSFLPSSTRKTRALEIGRFGRNQLQHFHLTETNPRLRINNFSDPYPSATSS